MKLAKSIIRIFNRTISVPKSLWEFIKYGGHTTVNISKLAHGEILKGKKILVTGGSSGIGLSIALKCISEGATVLITGRNEDKLERVFSQNYSDNLKTLVWDVSNIKIIKENLKEAEKLLGGSIDVLVNNAGIINGKDFLNVNEDIWDSIYSVNSKGLYFVSQKLVKNWLKNNETKHKKIINISSQGAFVGATYPYRMTKWDIAGLTQGLGKMLAPHGIIVNGIAPGIIATEMQKKYLNQNDNIYCSLNPLKRFALPEEIAELAAFLISDASNFITGQTIVCDGGFTIS